MQAGFDHLEIFMITASMAAFVFLASVAIFVVEETARILVQALSDAIVQSWHGLTKHPSAFGRLLSHLHIAKL